VFYKKREIGRNATEKVSSLTFAFLIIKNILCTLPEFTSLQTNDSYEFVNIMRILAVILSMPIAVIWLVQVLLYFNRIRKDTAFIQALSTKYLDKSSDSPEFFIYKSLTFGLYTILAAFIFTFDFYAENVNVLPDFLFYSLIIFSCLVLRGRSEKAMPVVICSVIGALISLTTCLIEKSFFGKFDISAVIKDFDAYNQYNLLVACYVAKAIVFTLALYFILRFIYNVFSIYILNKQQDNEQYFAEHNRKFKIRTVICFVLGVLSAVATVYRVISLTNFELSWVFYCSGIITSIIQISFIVSAVTLILFLHGEIKYNYKSHL